MSEEGGGWETRYLTSLQYILNFLETEGYHDVHTQFLSEVQKRYPGLGSNTFSEAASSVQDQPDEGSSPGFDFDVPLTRRRTQSAEPVPSADVTSAQAPEQLRPTREPRLSESDAAHRALQQRMGYAPQLFPVVMTANALRQPRRNSWRVGIPYEEQPDDDFDEYSSPDDLGYIRESVYGQNSFIAHELTYTESDVSPRQHSVTSQSDGQDTALSAQSSGGVESSMLQPQPGPCSKAYDMLPPHLHQFAADQSFTSWPPLRPAFLAPVNAGPSLPNVMTGASAARSSFDSTAVEMASSADNYSPPEHGGEDTLVSSLRFNLQPLSARNSGGESSTSGSAYCNAQHDMGDDAQSAGVPLDIQLTAPIVNGEQEPSLQKTDSSIHRVQSLGVGLGKPVDDEENSAAVCDHQDIKDTVPDAIKLLPPVTCSTADGSPCSSRGDSPYTAAEQHKNKNLRSPFSKVKHSKHMPQRTQPTYARSLPDLGAYKSSSFTPQRPVKSLFRNWSTEDTSLQQVSRSMPGESAFSFPTTPPAEKAETAADDIFKSWNSFQSNLSDGWLSGTSTPVRAVSDRGDDNTEEGDSEAQVDDLAVAIPSSNAVSRVTSSGEADVDDSTRGQTRAGNDASNSTAGIFAPAQHPMFASFNQDLPSGKQGSEHSASGRSSASASQPINTPKRLAADDVVASLSTQFLTSTLGSTADTHAETSARDCTATAQALDINESVPTAQDMIEFGPSEVSADLVTCRMPHQSNMFALDWQDVPEQSSVDSLTSTSPDDCLHPLHHQEDMGPSVQQQARLFDTLHNAASQSSIVKYQSGADIPQVQDRTLLSTHYDDASSDAHYSLEDIESQFEIMNLRIFHKKHATGFEDSKEFNIKLDSIIAGRYHVIDYLGSAAFSEAVQAYDLKEKRYVCLKIIKNNKDYFDQSLDEIKLLQYVNRADPDDEHNILRLFDFFYYKEHLILVCELLRANLYEWQKYNKESSEEPYFTLARIQSIARQVLRALSFLHSLNLMHADLKPENLLIKSYSRCEVKVIDLGSSCFVSDTLSPYVQSRSYRAPEVILGFTYDQKIDIWSLGCILAELASGLVLFQNESVPSMLARMEGILGPVPRGMIENSRYGHRFYTRSGWVYEQNPQTGLFEVLRPKRTSLRHRVPSADAEFLQFLSFLLAIDPNMRPTADEALQHPWLYKQYPPIQPFTNSRNSSSTLLASSPH